MSDTGIGAALRRKEDGRFLTGRGRYTDDIDRPGQLYGYVVRSPEAHAKIVSIDASEAQAAPGVVAVFTGADMAEDGIGGLPCGWQIHSKDGSPMHEPPHAALVADRVRHVGDQVALVVAETKAQAKAGAALVYVDYEPLPAVASSTQATAEGAPLVWDDIAGNVCYDWELGDQAATDAAIESAAHVVSLDIVNNRLIPNAIEPRAAIGDYDPVADTYTLYTSSQNPHVIRLLMGAFVMGIPEHKLRVVSKAREVDGGAFGVLHVGRTRSRSRHPGRAGPRRRGAVPGPSRAHGREHGSLSLDLRTLGSDVPARHALRRMLHDASHLCERARGLHQHRSGRRLSRCRQARGGFHAGAPRRQGGA
jgi:carbon-monoxide dehydrogenase large subunit